MTSNPLLNLMELKSQQSKEIENEELQVLYQTNPLIGAGGLIENLSDDQQRFLVAKMFGSTDVGAARACNINENTMRSWKQQDPEFKEVYRLVTTQPIEMAAQVSAFGFAKAIDSIVRMMDSNDIKVVQWAIERMLSIASVGKQRIEVTHKEDKGVSDQDVDVILNRLEQRKQQRNESDGEGSRVL